MVNFIDGIKALNRKPMPKTSIPRKYDNAFKIKVCKEHLAGDCAIEKTAKRYSIASQLLSEWLKCYQAGAYIDN